jgi:hypothetical protein
MSLLLAIPAIILVWLVCYGPPDTRPADPPRTGFGQHGPTPEAALPDPALPEALASGEPARGGVA